MDKRYAREKLTLLMRDLDSYSDDEFWRQMSRIAAGSTGMDHAEDIAKQRDALAAHVERIKRFWMLLGRDASTGMERSKLDDIMESSPATSLARRDLLKCRHHEGDDCTHCGGSGWRRRCNDAHCTEHGCDGGSYCFVAKIELRRQAEEPSQ